MEIKRSEIEKGVRVELDDGQKGTVLWKERVPDLPVAVIRTGGLRVSVQLDSGKIVIPYLYGSIKRIIPKQLES